MCTVGFEWMLSLEQACDAEKSLNTLLHSDESTIFPLASGSSEDGKGEGQCGISPSLLDNHIVLIFNIANN